MHKKLVASEFGMNSKAHHFLIIGYTGSKNHIQYALNTQQKISLLIEKQKYKQEFQSLFNHIFVVDNIFNLTELKKNITKSLGITAVLTRFEDYIGVVGALNQYLNLDGYSYQTSRNFGNKFQMKKKWLKHQVPCAEGICIDKSNKIKQFLQNHSLPLIMKKTSGTHSSFVHKIKTKTDLYSKRKQFLQSDYQIAKSLEGTNPECSLLLEEMLSGIEITVDSFVSNGQYTHTPICKYILPEELNIDDSYLPIRLAPIKLDKNIETKIFQITEKALKALGADNCVCHTELFYKQNSDDIYLVETTVRSGGYRSLMINTITDSNYDHNVFKAVSGDEIDQFYPNGKGCSVIEYFAEQEGKIEKIDLNFLDNLENVEIIRIRNQIGDVVKKGRDGGKSLLAIALKADNADCLEQQSIEIFKKIQKGISIK